MRTPLDSPGGDGPRLEYGMFLFDSGAVTVRVSLSPALDVAGAAHGLRHAVSIDDEPPQIVNVAADGTLRAWERMVADNVTICVTRHHLANAGEHVVKYWLIDPGVVLRRIVVDAGGMRPSSLGPRESGHGGATVGGRR